ARYHRQRPSESQHKGGRAPHALDHDIAFLRHEMLGEPLRDARRSISILRPMLQRRCRTRSQFLWHAGAVSSQAFVRRELSLYATYRTGSVDLLLLFDQRPTGLMIALQQRRVGKA